jgi:anthranilate phosphoribosyltransferase
LHDHTGFIRVRLMADLKQYIAKVATGDSLNQAEARDAFDVIMSGQATPAQIGGFLMALRVRGETVDEITGAVETMRAKMVRVQAPIDAIDIVGTGGDGTGTYNISTASVFVAAGCGLKIAKHGNRALSSKSGAGDILSALGIKLDITPEQISQCIDAAGVGFMFAPQHHAAMRFVGPARVELGTRTIFNLLGPLSNPAGTKRMLIGVFDKSWVEPLAHVLKNLGSEAVWVVHGSDGMDEMTTTGATHVAELKNGSITTFDVTPDQAGLAIADIDDLIGGDPEYNAAALRALLEGKKNAYRDIVVLNVAAALVMCDRAENLDAAARKAEQAIDCGAAHNALKALILTSNKS